MAFGRGLRNTDLDTTREDTEKASSSDGISPNSEEICKKPLWVKEFVGLEDEEM